MTNIIRNLIPFLLMGILITLASCNDDNYNNVEDEVVVTIPDTVSTIAVTGKVTDREGRAGYIASDFLEEHKDEQHSNDD